MNNYNHNNHYNDRRDYYQRNQQQNNRYQNNQYGGPPSGYNQNYNNSYGNYPPNQYNSYNQNHQPYSPRYDSYQPPQQQYQYNSNMYNQQSPPPYQYGQSYNNQQYSNIPPGDIVLTQQPQQQVPNDQDYMNSKLIDFRGRLHEYIPFAAPRRAIVRLYTGKQSDDWLILEFIQNMDTFIKYKAGVTFIYNIHNKMTHELQSLNEAIVNNYQDILTIPDGYKLFSKISEHVSPEILINIAKWCFDSFLQYHTNEPDYINLLSVFVKILYNKPDLYIQMINLDFYLKNPAASPIGSSIVDNCLDNVLSGFLNEINCNVSSLIEDKNLIQLVISFIIRGPKNVHDLIFATFNQQIEAFIAHPWKWKIVKALMSTISMSQKLQIAEKVCQCCSSVREIYMDELIKQALLAVPANYRLNSLLSLVQPVLDDNEFPLVNDFVKNIKYTESVS